MSKEIIKYKEGFISKIKKIFKKIFSARRENEQKVMDKKIQKDNFKENIKIKQDEEELNIKKLQKEYKAGNILEENMTDEKREKLIELYKKQNKELKDKIETKKQRIRKKLDDLK